MQHEDAAKLLEFVEASKSKGASDDFLTSFLKRRGWPEDDVYAVLGSYWQRAAGVSIPERTAGGESSRDAFLYLLSFSTLATWSSALGSLLFRFIDLWFPDPVARNHGYNLRSAVTWQMASLAVAFPIFLLVMGTILQEAQDHPERLHSSVRKWLTYIALLLTAGAMICDLIWFLNYFLKGELTSRFVLKALTVMVICGGIFVYYLGSLRWERNVNVAAAKRRSLKFGMVAAATVVASFCVAMGVAGTPSQQRHVEADRRRVQDLAAIAFAVHSWRQHTGLNPPSSPLPASLSELIGKGINLSQTLDPETGTAYEYHIRSGTTYELCATFSAPEEAEQVPRMPFWDHGKGRNCLTLDASQQSVW